MAAITPVANYAQTNFTVDTGTVYKTKIDANSIIMQRVVDNFAPHTDNGDETTLRGIANFILGRMQQP